MKLQLEFSLSGALDGDGIDDVGQFTISGSFNMAAQLAQFTKTYLGRHSVEYEGVYDGRNILGAWTLLWESGAFRIWPGDWSHGIEVEEKIELEIPSVLLQVK